jgi:ketosteroid isomerase-like protein
VANVKSTPLDVLAFGTHNDVIPGIEPWIATQWDRVWPKTSDFRFTIDQAQVLASPDGMMATVIAPWTSTGYREDGAPFPRPGRATMVFSRNGKGVAVHAFPHVAQPRCAADESCEPAGEGVVEPSDAIEGLVIARRRQRRPAVARFASYGALGVRRSVLRVGGSNPEIFLRSDWIASLALAMTA